MKPAASAGYVSGLWKGKGVTGLSISISAEGLRFYGETENGYSEIASKWGTGQSVEVKALAVSASLILRAIMLLQLPIN